MKGMYKFMLKGLLIVFVLLFHFFISDDASAQINLERVSIAERADGLGYVIRHHFDVPPDSFQVSQPDLYTLQVRFYGDSIQMNNARLPDDTVLEEIVPIGFEDGAGIQYQIQEGNYFLATVYFDQNQRDVLIPLQNALQAVLAVRAVETLPLFKISEPVASDMEETTEPVFEVQESHDIIFEESTESKRRFADILHNSNPSSLNRVPIGDPFELYMRSIYPKSSDMEPSTFLLAPRLNPTSSLHTLETHPWENRSFFRGEQISSYGVFNYRIYNPEFYTSNNSKLPLGENDGALWQGRGSNYFVSAGAGVQYGPFTAVFRPQFVYSENIEYDEITSFDISVYPRFGGSEFQMYLMHADIPLRFGDTSISTFDPGDSFIQAEYSGFAAGLSNERMWTGPAVHNPLIFSNHAPGFLHGYISTVEPFRTRLGNLEGRWIWGRLKESEFYDDNPDNDNRFITALTLNYSPSFISGLHVGFTRAAYSYSGNSSFMSNMFMAFKFSQPENITDPEEAFFNMTSYYARWAFPNANFEAYAEWGRHDSNRTIQDFLAEPEFNRGYVLGFLKNFEITNSRRLLLNTEITKLENSSVTSTQRGYTAWYTNPVIGHGFTHRGRVLGASIGPGSSTQHMHLHYYDRWGMLGISGTRIAHFMDRHFEYEDYFRSFVNFPQFYFILSRHEIEMRYGFKALIFLPNNFELEAGYIISKIENRFNLRMIDIDNNQYSFTLRYNFNSFTR